MKTLITSILCLVLAASLVPVHVAPALAEVGDDVVEPLLPIDLGLGTPFFGLCGGGGAGDIDTLDGDDRESPLPPVDPAEPEEGASVSDPDNPWIIGSV